MWSASWVVKPVPVVMDLEPGRLLREPGQHEGAGGDPCDEDRGGDDGEQSEECGHTGVGSVKLEATRGFGGLHMGSAAQCSFNQSLLQWSH